MDNFIIEGGHPLQGEVSISGAKNAVLPIMAATLIHPGEYTIRNVPDLRDTRTMIRLLEIIGSRVQFRDHVVQIDTRDCNSPEAPYELVKTMRASFYVLGPLLARFGTCRVSLPGGCNWGPRPVNLHIEALEALSAEIKLEGGYIVAQGTLIGANIDFPVSSVGATGNTLMAAVAARGTTIIRNASREPEIDSLVEFLRGMGAKIEGLGTTTLTIQGTTELHGATTSIISDRIEAGTFLIAGAMVGADMVVRNVIPEHLRELLVDLKKAGVELEIGGDYIRVSAPAHLRAVDLATAPYPGYPTDLQAQWIALMSLAEGTSRVTDNIYLDRFAHVPELQRMGADISMDEHTAIVTGPVALKAAAVMSTDIRASAALVLAALAAEGTTELSRVYHIDRGYEGIEQKFAGLGAQITRQEKKL